MEADTPTHQMLKSSYLLVWYVCIRRVLASAKQKNAGIVKCLIDDRFVKSLLNRVGIIVGFKDDVVAEQKRVNLLLVNRRGRLVNLGEFRRILEEAREALVN